MKANWFKVKKQALKERKVLKESGEALAKLDAALKERSPNIPVILVSYNNAVYLKLTLEQLNRYGIIPVILDNCSTDSSSQKFLHHAEENGLASVVFLPKNYGHLVGFLKPIYSLLPDVFAYSDPDLLYNKKLPENFLQELSSLNRRFNVYKSGFALDLMQSEEIIDATIECKKIKPIEFDQDFSIRDWEGQFWRFKLEHEKLEVYAAKIDTTFAVYDKNKYRGDFFDAVRVAGEFSCIHLPWFPNKDIMTGQEKKNYLEGNSSTSWIK